MNARPAITSPVMRVIGVADTTRSSAFYRDLLGFEVHQHEGGTEATYGPARIRFGEHDYAPGDWDTPRPMGSAILYFQTDDVVGMHAAVRSRGGNPSELERVNWIKIQVFQIRDPDGHTLWFGQSYDEPDVSTRRRDMRQALPELPFDNVPAAVAYYRDVLGFGINYQQEDLGVMYRDEITILLIARSEQHNGIGSFEVYVADADALYSEFLKSGANLQGVPISRPWGLRDFRVLDLEGNRITFAQTFE